MHLVFTIHLRLLQTYRRIVRVDLRFPGKPAVSELAKDFVAKVSRVLAAPWPMTTLPDLQGK
jgi:hypothetical protein